MFKRFKDGLYILKYWRGLMFDYPRLTLESVDYDEYWRVKRGNSMGELSDWQLERAKFVIRALRGKTVESVCDIAAGEGAILNYIGSELEIKKLIGTDISDVALEHIRSFGIEGIKLDIGKVEDLKNIPVADYEILFEILEHVPHSELLLKEVFTKSRKGVFFSFPNTGFFPHRWRLLFGRFPMQWKLFPGEHVRFWTKKDLYWWLESLGYRNYTVYYYKGVPILNKIWPSLFAAAFVVSINKSNA